MLKGKYLNPKYAKWQKKRQRTVIVTASLLLSAFCISAIFHVDNTIRATMLPAAPPVAAIEEQSPMCYRLELLGKEYTFSTQWLHSLVYSVGITLRTPPASVRTIYQLRAFLTRQLPRNMRSDTKARTEL